MVVAPEITSIRNGLLKVGFREEWLQADVPLPGAGERSIPILAFADRPFDSRTASIAVLHGLHDEQDLVRLRPLGAPLVFASGPGHCDFWSQGAGGPQFQERIAPTEIPRFFEAHQDSLAPRAIYRAKLWGRLDQTFQLSFVDAGLMPVIEHEAGMALTRLVERVVSRTQGALGWGDMSEANGRWLVKATFWLLAAKILQDKAVKRFVSLDLTDVDEVYERLAQHYNSEAPNPVEVGSKAKREALIGAAEQIAAFGHCGSVTTEALAFLYESALIDKVTRQKLGTHSTPPWLVDYIVGRLRPWIEDIPVDMRRVFEPACGHAAFLVSAMRLLSDLLPADWNENRRTYLRRRLRGLEIDRFAIEIARLSLTLADVPNPNGWSLAEGDMFAGDLAREGIERASIVLGNPPFENFKTDERDIGWLPNKASEVFRRVVEHLPVNGVFGFVLPQTFLSSAHAGAVREQLLREYEVSEISLFADRVFRKGSAESAVLIGRRLKKPITQAAVRYQRIREGQIDDFSRTYRASSVQQVEVKRFGSAPSSSLFLSDLTAVWDHLRSFGTLADIAVVGQGFVHKSDSDPTLPPRAVKVSPIKRAGFVAGYEGWSNDQATHALPQVVWFNFDPECIRRPHSGTEVGTRQVLLNYAPVSRGPWRLKALLDKEGHAVTSRFIVVRPQQVPLLVIWAILNSPMGNAYVYCMSRKRDVQAGTMRQMPMPSFAGDLSALESAVADYLQAVGSASGRRQKRRGKDRGQQTLRFNGSEEETSSDTLKMLHWKVDAEVLRLYALPEVLERAVLDLFTGRRRLGVPFEQLEYFPSDFSELNRLEDLLAITAYWPQTNHRRAELIDLDESGGAPEGELEKYQRLANARVSLLRPSHFPDADRLIEQLKRDGLWRK